MKTLILATLASAAAVSPIAISAAEAAPQTTRTVVRERPNGTVVRRTTTTYRNWRVGDRFDQRRAQYYRTVPNWRSYRLYAPRRGQHWVRSGRNAVLVRNNGTVVAVRGNIF